MTGPSVTRVIAGFSTSSGGPTASAVSSMIASASAGVSTTCLVPADGGSMSVIGRLVGEGVDVRSFPLSWGGRGAARRWGVSVRLVAWLLFRAGGRCDVLHAHGAWTCTTFATLVAAWVHRVPAVLTPHESLTDFDVHKGGRWPKQVAKRGLRRFLLRSFDLVIFASAQEETDSVPAGQSVRDMVLPHPVAVERVPRSERPSGVVAVLGRIDGKKNLELAIRALSLLPERIRLVVAGDGDRELARRLTTLAHALGVTDRIEWVGWIDTDGRRRLFETIDVLIVPSAYESFGMAAAEGLASGVPVVVSRRVGIAELVERHACGRVVDCDERAVAEAIAEITRDSSLRARLGAAGLRAAQEEFSPKRHGVRMRHAYETLCGERT